MTEAYFEPLGSDDGWEVFHDKAELQLAYLVVAGRPELESKFTIEVARGFGLVYAEECKPYRSVEVSRSIHISNEQRQFEKINSHTRL